ncbi:MSMEG_1061 family FMN-dependent PPOX-type flavoprotein [Kitasatospora sp. NPDC050543]|uniref:MSMEG_1061 family FMN-dependent PPOX-type flavoprotein n=1 Tax=Kitasatospora sp. NPDC050543 TaxID=3364054 RepID=UPI0037AAD9AE
MTITPESDVPSAVRPTPPGDLFEAILADAVREPAGLRAIYPEPGEVARHKELDHINEVSRRLIGCASLVLIATADAAGRCDVSPRGGPPGLVSVLDEHTLAIPDATGNKRLDSLHNILETGRIGLLFVIPGRDTTLRLNGRACVSTDPRLLEQLTPVGKPPLSAIVVRAEEVYPHCPKAFLRSAAWKPGKWLSSEDAPSSAQVTLSHLGIPGLTIEMVEQAERESLLYRYE